MFDIAPSELLAVAVIALLVIGPKDLPRVMRVVGQWVGKARGMARHFRSGFDNMIREAELEDMEKKWKEENERIMQAYPSAALIENVPPPPLSDPPVAETSTLAPPVSPPVSDAVTPLPERSA
ncbi:Sec-independent protein translocase protein TatB [Sphingomonas sp.]|uniref:Sec-independent protein translocase protein TatB n=1 Tax=Sphingomonas sp. TaxID=28214 RepID=UPI00345E0044